LENKATSAAFQLSMTRPCLIHLGNEGRNVTWQ
jgi:hypothetical protein